MKKCLLSAILAVGALGLHAEYNRLVFTTTDGNVKSVGLTNLNVKFSDGDMIASSAGESVKIDLASLKSMEFGNGEASIVAVPNTRRTPVAVYSVDGICVGKFDSEAEAMNLLPAGLYITKDENGLTSKMLITR